MQRTHCHQGHALTPENTYTRPNGTRECHTCRQIRRREEKAAARADRAAAFDTALAELGLTGQTCPNGHPYTYGPAYFAQGTLTCAPCTELEAQQRREQRKQDAAERRAALAFDNRYTVQDNGCWQWTGPKSRSSTHWYGNHKGTPAHRYSYERTHGPIPDGLQLDHLCRNTLCVNPDHLEPVTPRTNTLRGVGPTAINAAKSECVRGHPLVADNIRRDETGAHCRECSRINAREQHAAIRAAAKALGLTQQQYIALHGRSTATAITLTARTP